MRSPDNRRKLLQWSFTTPSFASSTLEHLSKVQQKHEEVEHITFAVCDDDVGNRYVEGLIKFSKRCRETTARKVTASPFVDAASNVNHSLIGIYLRSSSVVEHGVITNFQVRVFINRLKHFKTHVSLGEESIEELIDSYPGLFQSCPHMTIKCAQ